MLYLKISQTKVLCVTTVLTRKDLIALQTRHTALPGEQCVAFARLKIILKIPRNVSDSKRRENQNQEIKTRSTRKPFVLKEDEDGEKHFYEVVDKICTLNQQCDHKKAFANLLISKKRISVNFQLDSGSTCSILPVAVYKEISGDHDLQDLNTTVRPTLLLYEEKTKIQTLGARKCFVFNPATRKEGIIQFRIVNEDLTPLLGLRDSEELKLFELIREKIATLDCGKPDVPSSASELHTPLTYLG